jgi:DNA polymerase I-like protein with 3'-5' exonuclease and polymerase domains
MVAIYDPQNKGDELWCTQWPVDKFTRQVRHVFSQRLAQVLLNESVAKVFHNAKHDLSMLQALGYRVAGRVEDTSFTSRVTNTLEPSYALKPLSWKHCGIDNSDEAELDEAVSKMRIKARRLGWAVHPDSKEADYWLCQYAEDLGFPGDYAQLAERYCMMDVVRTGRLWEKQYPLLADRYYRKTYDRELELLPVVMKMEARGMALYVKQAEKELEEAKHKAAHHLQRCREIVQKPDFNPGSAQQLARVLYLKKPTDFYPLKLNKATGVKEPNLSKPPDRYPVVYGLRCTKRTGSGGESTDWKALRPYQENPLVREMMMYRSADKSIDTFFQKYLDMAQDDIIVPASKRNPHKIIHCSLNQCGTITGRFSCSDPNLQQVANPESSPRGTDVHARRPFGPRPGYNWYAIDYRQMELRVFAACAKVQSLLDEIYAGRDPNNYLTNKAWGGPNNPAALEAMAHSLELGHDYPAKEEISSVWEEYGWDAAKAKAGMRSSAALAMAEWYLERHGWDIVKAEASVGKSQSRQRGKTVMFVKYYGGGGSACADILYVPVPQANKFLRDLDKQFPEINQYIEQQSELAKRKGYIVTGYGRKLNVDSDTAYRAVNYRIQGTCADLMKRSIQRTHDFFLETGLDAHVLMTIHDEMLIEVKKEHTYKWLLREVCRIMKDTEGCIDVPMDVEMKRMRTSWEYKEKMEL